MGSVKFDPTTLITKSLFEDIFRDFFGDETVRILGYSSKAAVGTGENYTSDMFRVGVTLSRNNVEKEFKSVILKVQPVGNQMETLTNNMHLFTKEMEMYVSTLPRMHRLLGESSLATICLGTLDTPTRVLVVEDLQPKGYVMYPRQKGLDYEHSVLVMTKIARFHAASVVLADQDQLSMKNYYDGIYSDEPALLPWLQKGIKSVIESCKMWEDMQKFGDKLERLGFDAVLARGLDAARKRPGGFNVLNHGDMWTNNMLFSYDPDGRLQDLKFVDFQIVKYSSPALDLHYFLTTSVSDEVRSSKLDQLLDVYYGQLLLSLAELNYSLDTVPSRESFRRDFHTRGFYGVLAAATVLPMVKSDKRPDATFEQLMIHDGPGSFRHHCFTNEAYRKSLRQVFTYYDNLGVMD